MSLTPTPEQREMEKFLPSLSELQKTKPRQITIVETDESVPVGSMVPVKDSPVLIMCTDKIWRIKEE